MAKEHDFGQYSEIALRAVTDEKVAATLSKFMWDYAGDPVLIDRMPPIRRQRADGHEYNYDESLEKGFTNEGHLVHVRRSLGGSALMRPQIFTHFVVTSNIHTGDMTEWRINDVRHSQDNLHRLSTELVLTTDRFDALDGEAEIHDENPILAELTRREFETQRLARDALQARLMLSSTGVMFKPFGGSPEIVYDIREAIRDTGLLRSYMAQRAFAAASFETPPLRDAS